MLICVTTLCSVNCSKTSDTVRFRNNLGRSHVCVRAPLTSLEVGNSPSQTRHICAQTQNFNYIMQAHKLVDDLRFTGRLNTDITFLRQAQENKYRIMLNCCFVWVWNLVAHIEGGT